MGKMKIYELAKQLNLTSKEIMAKAKELGIEVKTHMSSIEENEINKIKDKIGKREENKTKKEEKKQSSPVIIRREIIITDEEKKESKSKQIEQRNKQVGFVERNKNADYNIVYRNKPTKPMTVSELFGIGKKEEKIEKEEKVEKVEKKEENMQENKET